MMNYAIVNNKAYTTEGNVLVYNVFVYNLAKKTTRDQILSYFKQFGEIKNVRLMNKIGFVNFCDPVVAAKVLHTRTHLINKKLIGVRACDSWHQPGLSASDDSTSLLNIDDDCLETILKKLSMIDQFNLGRTCCRLRNIFLMNSKNEHKIFSLDNLNLLTLRQTRPFLEMAGPQIRILRGQIPFKQTKSIIGCLGTFCTNVNNLSIERTTLNASMLRKLLKNMSSVTVLKLINADLNDSCITPIKMLSNLKVLSLDRNRQISGRFVKDLTTVESLCLNECLSLTESHFSMICKSLTELSNLEIRDCPHLAAADFKNIVKHLNKLESLHICSASPQILCAAQLPKLKHLLLFDNYDSIRPTLLAELIKLLGKQLETFCVDTVDCLDLDKVASIAELKKLKTLMCPNNSRLDDDCLKKLALLQDLEVINLNNCSSFTNKGLLNLIKSCHKLHTLHISCCKQIRNSFYKDVLDLLKAQSSQTDQRKPLTIFVVLSDNNQFVVTNPDFESASELVKFKFKYIFDGDDNFNEYYIRNMYEEDEDDLDDLDEDDFSIEHSDYDHYYGYGSNCDSDLEDGFGWRDF